MTREEAIQIINCYDIGFYDLSGEKIPADKLADAFYMAIEALTQDSRKVTQESDLISREEVLRAIITAGEVEPDLGYTHLHKVIESLPSATCDDCIWHVCNYNKIDWDGDDGYISRRDAIEAIASRDETNGTVKVFTGRQVNEILSALPSAEAEWIPCSERLPDVGEDVLLQFRVAQCVGNRCLDYDDNGWVINSGGEWQTPILDGDEEPIAWMPLPKPYKVEIEE